MTSEKSLYFTIYPQFQYLLNQIYELTLFIAKHIHIKQWTFYREFTLCFFSMDLNKLPSWAQALSSERALLIL